MKEQIKHHGYLDELSMQTSLTILKLQKGGQPWDSNMNRVEGGSKNNLKIVDRKSPLDLWDGGGGLYCFRTQPVKVSIAISQYMMSDYVGLKSRKV